MDLTRARGVHTRRLHKLSQLQSRQNQDYRDLNIATRVDDKVLIATLDKRIADRRIEIDNAQRLVNDAREVLFDAAEAERRKRRAE